MRTHLAGELRENHIGTDVVLTGWVSRRRDHGGVIFVDLRDKSGLAQVVFRDGEVLERAHALRAEYCLKINGTVGRRPEGSENPALGSGTVEVGVTDFEILAESAPLPFQLDEPQGAAAPLVNEETRFHYRYLDLRRPEAARILRLRSAINAVARQTLLEQDFVEVETPTLTRSTPEGARDFVVPARLKPGSWYALPQSPQLFKQLLMVGGIERYFQLVRCYRDEDFRADRQPEFTQLDLEMSFVSQDDVIALAEDVVAAVWGLQGEAPPLPLPRITYEEAMRRYGSDKPDLRFGVELVDCTEYFKDTPFRVFQAEHVGAVVMAGGADQPRRTLDGWQDWARQRGAKGLAYVLVGEDGALSGPVAKNLSEAEQNGLAEQVGAKPGDCVFFAAGDAKSARSLLGAARCEIAARLGLIAEGPKWAFAWVVDFPLLEPAAQAKAAGDVAVGEGAWTAVHHAFTAPAEESLATLEADPGSALSQAYDLVCNGHEIGGGSIRIHRREVQERVLKLMGFDEERAQAAFGFLLDAFAYGAPPHGGIAFGWDRIAALLAGADSIREVIAFPKSGGGQDPLTGAPGPIAPAQRAETGVDWKPEKK